MLSIKGCGGVIIGKQLAGPKSSVSLPLDQAPYYDNIAVIWKKGCSEIEMVDGQWLTK